MSLQPKRETGDAGIPVFSKVLELFTGGFSLTSSTLSGFPGMKLPKGALLKVDESTRTATPIKTAKVATGGGGTTTILVEKGHFFQAGDKVGKTVDAKAYAIGAIAASGDYDQLTIQTAIDTATAGDVLFESTEAGPTAAEIKTVANAISRYDSYLEAGYGVTAALRATVYKNRVQPHQAGHLADVEFIHFSESK